MGTDFGTNYMFEVRAGSRGVSRWLQVLKKRAVSLLHVCFNSIPGVRMGRAAAA